MPLGNTWAFPSRSLSYDATLGAMKTLASRISDIFQDCPESGHPVELNFILEPTYLAAAEQVSQELGLAEPIPKLCALVTVSAFDAAVHDAYGKVQGRSCYECYGSDLLTHDLSRYLGRDFEGESLDRYILPQPVTEVPIYHSVGALDALVKEDVEELLEDGLPETLAEWIPYNGLTHFKVKLNGQDQDWDVERVVGIDRVVSESMVRSGERDWKYLLDFNEMCPDVTYLLETLNRIKDLTPRGFERIECIEQPTARDLEKDRENLIHEAAKLRPVIIDESLTDRETLLLARTMGYTGVALKACKGQTHAMLMASAAQKYGMSLSVMDLTCPGASFIHSAGIAAHVPRVSGIEHNSRQYLPDANRPWSDLYPGLFNITDGRIKTSSLNKPGLGATGV
jgi:L-alanine-DL-glutamate epimerase-like enolase superfamily enzyme